jgi:hypothetical protein
MSEPIEQLVDNLSREVATLRSLVISIVLEQKDPEGEYRAEFVNEVLEALKEPATHTFTSSKDFLKQLRKR